MRKIADVERLYNPQGYIRWQKFIKTFTFSLTAPETVKTTWKYPQKGEYKFSLKQVTYYTRGDIKKIHFYGDPIQEQNARYFLDVGKKIARRAGFIIHAKDHFNVSSDIVSLKRYLDEEKLSDAWIRTIDVNKIDVPMINETCTAPEMRYIIQTLGHLKGKTLLDIGCGLGEASIYFALKGARVTAIDISHAMIETAKKLAKRYAVKIDTHQSSIEHLELSKAKQFDIIYVGNLFHHVNIDKALKQIRLYLKPNGILVCWEPVHYNPIINIYRKIATKVRSKDERPVRFSDINKFRNYFSRIQLKWFWLTTLLIFIVMVFIQRRDPNKERFWKAVVAEGEKWKPIYDPLAKLDNWLLKMFPILNPLCWNVVIIASGKL